MLSNALSICTNTFSCFILISMSEKNKKKKYPGVSAIFWIVFALILLILFLVNKNRIFSVLQTTGFFSKVFGTEPEFIVNHPSDDTNKPIAELESSQETTENEPQIVVLNAVSGQATVSTGQPAVSSETPVAAQSVTQNQTQNTSASTPTTNTTQNASASNSSAAASTNNSNTSTSNIAGRSGIIAHNRRFCMRQKVRKR